MEDALLLLLEELKPLRLLLLPEHVLVLRAVVSAVLVHLLGGHRAPIPGRDRSGPQHGLPVRNGHRGEELPLQRRERMGSARRLVLHRRAWSPAL